MNKQKAIPDGFMTVGEIAKKMNTTVRTLQHYDKEGVLKPSAESEGGRRLYTDKDVIKLYQILTMKQLGFSLDDIKNRLILLDTPEAVADELSNQAVEIQSKIDSLSKILNMVETLKGEVLQMKSVDWHKYADIVAIIQSEYIGYWVIKHFDNKIMNCIRNRDDNENMSFIDRWRSVTGQAEKLHKAGISPKSQQGMDYAKEFWNFIEEFTDGDMSLLPELLKFEGAIEEWDDNDLKTSWENAKEFTQNAIDQYFTNIGYDPFMEEKTNGTNE